MSIRLERIEKSFGDFAALHGVSLEAKSGEFLALLGPSGSGKTTLLRIMAGLEFPDVGKVYFGDEDVTALAVRERRVGFVFQHYALFRHMSIAENVAFGLRVRKRRERPGRAAIAARVQELLDLVQLGGLGERYPGQLSGGQRQRVALARALAVDPKLLLLDEPFGALDAKVRKDLRRWLRELHDRVGLTSVFVTHDQEEALELADRVVVMNNGAIEQVATPQAIYDSPASAFVFDFVGESNRVPVRVAGGKALLDGAPLALPEPVAFDGDGELFFRPHDARVGQAGEGTLSVRVRQVRRSGGISRLEACLVGHDLPIDIFVDAGTAPEAGQIVALALDRATVFPKAAERGGRTAKPGPQG